MTHPRPVREHSRQSVGTKATGGLLALVLIALVAACSGSGGGALPSSTATPSRSASASGPSLPLPSASRDSRTGRPTASQPSTASPEPTGTDREAESTSASESPTPAPTTAADSSGSSDSSTWLIWALIGLVVLALAVALVRRRQSRRRDERSFDLALAEARWLDHEALPTLLSASRDERRGAWQVARPRVAALEEQLAPLASPGSDTLAAVNARHLKTAVAGVRSALDEEAQATSPDVAGEAHGAARQAARQLGQVLTELEPSGAGTR